MCMPQIIDREREKFPFLHFCAFWTSLGLLVDLTFFFLPVISQTSDISFARSPPLLCHHRGFLRAQVGRSGVTANVQLTNILRILVDNICLINVEAIFKQMYCKSRFCPESSILYCLISLALILLISTSEVSKTLKYKIMITGKHYHLPYLCISLVSFARPSGWVSDTVETFINVDPLQHAADDRSTRQRDWKRVYVEMVVWHAKNVPF